MIITVLQARVEAADPLMVKAGTNNLEASHSEIEAKDFNIVTSISELSISERHISTEPYSIWQQSQTLLSGKSNK